MVDGVNPSQFSVIQDVDLKSMDLESAMMYVQMQRAENMEIQLRDQLKEVQARNEKNAKLNEFLQALVAIANSLKTGAKNEDKIGGDAAKAAATLNQLAKNANIVMDFFKKLDTSKEVAEASADLNKWTQIAKENQANMDYFFNDPDVFVDGKVGGELTPEGQYILKNQLEPQLANSNAKIAEITERISDLKYASQGSLSKETTKGEIETAINKIKGQLDTNNSTNQLDMLRLQSLNSKRNEAFELITNFIKKMLDSRLSIISNMR